MGEEGKAVAFQPGAGQPVENAPSGATGKGSAEYLTREEARQLLEKTLHDAKSYSDQIVGGLEKRVSKRYNDWVQTASGVMELTDEVKAKAKERIRAEEVEREAPAEPAAAQAPAQAQAKGQSQADDDPAAYANAGAKRLEKKYGVSLTTADPEAANLPKSGDPDEWLDAYEAALQAKKQRAEIPSAARITTMPGGSIPAMSQDAMLAEIEAWNQNPDPAKLPRIRELRAKLKQG